MPRKKKQGQVIITFLLQGLPRVIMDEELEYPHGFPTIDAAREWIDGCQCNGITAADFVMIVDLGNGETETY